MKVAVVSESPLLPVLFGLGLSYGLTSHLQTVSDLQCTGLIDRLTDLAVRLAHAPMQGERKFLRQLSVILDVNAPRYWWPEFDQHKIGTVTQSESTMHTLANHPLKPEDFEGTVWIPLLNRLNDLREKYLETRDHEVWREFIQNLPQSYLQRRIVSTNYAQLQNIVTQRTGHKLREWHQLIGSLFVGLQHHRFIWKEN